MVNPFLRPLVERLLRGDFRLHDLNTIVLALRAKTDGRKAIRDIGDFVAHREDRFRGVIADETQQWFHLARSTTFYLNQPVDFNNLHPEFLSSLEITLSRIDRLTFAKDIGISRHTAHRLLKEIVSRSKNEDGKISVTVSTQKELDLITKLASRLIVRPAFDDTKLFDEFVAVLKSQGLLAKDEVAKLEYLKPILSRYAVTLMHKCIATLKDGSRVELFASPNFYDRTINVTAAIDIYPVGHPKFGVKIACSIYTTKIDPVEACESTLLSISDWQPIHIEIAPDGKITSLR